MPVTYRYRSDFFWRSQIIAGNVTKITGNKESENSFWEVRGTV